MSLSDHRHSVDPTEVSTESWSFIALANTAELQDNYGGDDSIFMSVLTVTFMLSDYAKT